MGRKRSGAEDSAFSDEVELAEEPEDDGDFEASVLREDGSARQQGGRRRGARGLDEREGADLPDEPPPGYPG